MESTRRNNSIDAINNARMLLNELRSDLSREETKRIRDKLFKKEAIYNFFQQKHSFKEKKVLKNIARYLKNISMHLKNLKQHFKKLQKYQYGYISKKAISRIMILMQQKMLESFLMNIEVIFHMKKQRELEKSFVE